MNLSEFMPTSTNSKKVAVYVLAMLSTGLSNIGKMSYSDAERMIRATDFGKSLVEGDLSVLEIIPATIDSTIVDIQSAFNQICKEINRPDLIIEKGCLSENDFIKR